MLYLRATLLGTRWQPNDVFAQYQLLRKLGVGGMAEVWLAQPVGKGHRFPRVVIKRVHPFLAEDTRLLDLFFDEVRLAQRLIHPNVVNVFEAGRVGDDYYLAMEYIDGLDLRRCLRAHGGPLWPALAAQLVADACVGLEYAHTLKDELGEPLSLVHRDISPDNLMVSRTGWVKLVDFGIARASNTQNTTRTGTRKGKVRYMAPEYLRDHQADAATDVYAMGATLFELVTGHAPFGHHRSPTTVMSAIVREGLPRADSLRPSLPGELVSTIAAATERDRSRRLKSARELEQRLRAFLREYAPPLPSEIGAEVALWQERTGEALPGKTSRDKRPAGSYGQLETTEFMQAPSGHGASFDALDAEQQFDPDPSVPVSVHVAHSLDRTEFSIPAPAPAAREEEPDEDFNDAATDPSLPVGDRLPSVIVEPELEREPLDKRDKHPRKSGKGQR